MRVEIVDILSNYALGKISELERRNRGSNDKYYLEYVL